MEYSDICPLTNCIEPLYLNYYNIPPIYHKYLSFIQTHSFIRKISIISATNVFYLFVFFSFLFFKIRLTTIHLVIIQLKIGRMKKNVKKNISKGLSNCNLNNISYSSWSLDHSIGTILSCNIG